jgi:lipid-A-disaccharide synthase
MRIGIVANEPSGDQLAAGVIHALREARPDVSFIGVAGPRMAEAGCETLLDQERLSVMGLVEVIKHLPEVLRLRRQLGDYFLAQPPDLFIGVDAPDFNLTLERRLRRAGIPTAHLVSPTVWAWRPGRVKGLRSAVDLVLSIFPFEESFLRERGVPARYIGHPLADEIPLVTDRGAARQALGLPISGQVIALLPGSRVSEVKLLARPFIETAYGCQQQQPGLAFVVPLVSLRLRGLFEEILAQTGLQVPLTLINGRGREVMIAADAVLTASGTATLEALLLQRPMVVGYRLDPLTYRLVKALDLIKVPQVAMANILAGRELAPEFIQDRCRAELMVPALLALLEDGGRLAEIQQTYAGIHRQLRLDAGRQAARALLDLVEAG